MNVEELIPGLRSLLAHRLVERHGLKQKDVAKALGISPSAVTQYLKGGRASRPVKVLSRSDVTLLIDAFCEKVAIRTPKAIPAEFFELAYQISSIVDRKPLTRSDETDASSHERELNLEALRRRLQAEQEAAELFMSVATQIRNNLVRLVFRQIASDSIRHADILMTVISRLENGKGEEMDLPPEETLKKLLSYEQVAHVHSLDGVKLIVHDDLVQTVLESVKADEEKHSGLLIALMKLKASERHQWE
ncbi:MAG: helix-turn-helix domain-containing protein [Conexivisphaerales archaeon]|jgi:transcriptional regulator with XRE-family HTH domain